jgi:hypothetical protein
MGENHQVRKYNKRIMSQANAAARKRRAGGASISGMPEPVAQQTSPAGAGLTLPQVIALVDKRLVTLETFMRDTKIVVPAPAPAQTQAHALAPAIDDEMLDEINTKFDLLAGEVAELKDMLVKLQSYTMEVNKKLFDERIQLLSDVKDTDTMTFTLNKSDSIKLELSDDE